MLNYFRCLGVDDLPHGFLMESYLMKVAFLDNRIGVTTGGTYSISVTETIGGCHSVGIDALLIVDKLRFRAAFGNPVLLLV